MEKRGPKPKYDYWLTEDGLILLRGWARDGLTDTQISQNMGIGLSTLSEWKHKFPEIMTSLKENKDIADNIIENALYEKAKEKDLGAMIFWLKNRRPEKWREKRDVELTGEMVVINDDLKQNNN